MQEEPSPSVNTTPATAPLHGPISLATESQTFLSKISFLSQHLPQSTTNPSSNPNQNSTSNSSPSKSFNLVLPGDLITREPGYIQGRGTYEETGAIYSSLIGHVKQTDRLVSVVPLKSRYVCKTGDIVIGRVTEILNKKWKVDIASSDAASLHLNAVKLPEEQRRKTEEDEKQMRKFLREGDLVCAEVQSVNQDGTISLHIRSDKFGKLGNGSLLNVEHSLVKQHLKHIVDLTFGVKIILAMNGKVWLEPVQLTENSIDQIARLKNIIQTLDQNFVALRIDNILELYNSTLSVPAASMNGSAVREVLLSMVAQSINKTNANNVGDIIRGQMDVTSNQMDQEYEE